MCLSHQPMGRLHSAPGEEGEEPGFRHNTDDFQLTNLKCLSLQDVFTVVKHDTARIKFVNKATRLLTKYEFI